MEDESEKEYNNIVKFCRVTQTSYSDYSFPPDDTSIGEIVALESNRRLDEPIEVVNLYWLRPCQTEHHEDSDGDYEWSILNNPKPSDVNQSSLIGNCSIISAMAVIAERPDILDQIFPSKEISPEGVYRVRLHIEGEWKTILVDDYFPCFLDSGKMATAIGKRKQLWVPLIEKAMAKVFGSYSVLSEGANINLPLTMLTGDNCCRYYIPKDPDEFDMFWNVLMSSLSSGFLLCCSSHEEEICIRDKKVPKNHAFSIHTLNDEYKNRLLQLRNPWGRSQWTGKWSKEWDGWPTSMKEKLLIDGEKEDGMFWMELDDFLDMFESVMVCKIHSNWHQFRQKIIVGLDSHIVKFKVTETCEASFSEYFNTFGTIKRVDMILSVHRISQDNIIGEMVGRSPRLNISSTFTDELLLTPGEYIIMLFNLENLNKINFSKTVTCYSSKPIFHELIPSTHQMFNQALREMILKDGTLDTGTVYGVYYRSLTKIFLGKIIMIDNYNNNIYFHFKHDATNCENVKSSRGSLLTFDVIPPRSYQIIAILSLMATEQKGLLSGSHRHFLRFEKFIGRDLADDNYKICQKLQHYPIIDSLDLVHYPQSIYYDLGSNMDELLPQKKECPKRIKHFLWLCDCRE